MGLLWPSMQLATWIYVKVCVCKVLSNVIDQFTTINIGLNQLFRRTRKTVGTVEKTLPASKLPNVTCRLISSTCTIANICIIYSLTTTQPLKTRDKPSAGPFKPTQCEI